MAELERHLARSARLDSAVRATLVRAEALYRSGRTRSELLAEREPVFAELAAELARLDPECPPAERIVNNARLLQFRRYLAGAEQFEQMWRAAHATWPAFWRLVERRAQSL
jgi:hypothetical protein